MPKTYILRGNTLFQKPDKERPNMRDYKWIKQYHTAMDGYESYLSTLPHYPASDELIAFMGDRKEIGEDEISLIWVDTAGRRFDHPDFEINNHSHQIAYPKRQEEDVWATAWNEFKETDYYKTTTAREIYQAFINHLKQSYRITKI